uniref:Diacylglycerol kinase accessory domain-containing protein n=1 Tax=Glycine max TaxID=3847 RepID=K7MS69_SOYBN
MDSPSSSTTGDTSKVPIKSSSSIVESLRGCGISSGTHVDKEELRKNLTMPKYLRFAMRDSIMFKDPTAGENLCIRSKDDHKAVAPSTPMIVFINPRSGGRHGPFLKERLQHLMSEEQVLDMLDVKPHEFLQYGLGCLEMLTGLGDSCAKETRKRIRIMGGSFPFSWKAAIKRTLYKASIGPICRLDSWRLSLSMPEGTIIEPPHSLKHTIEFTLDEGLEFEGELSENVICYEGVFYNYFSIGMDAQVAYGFHHLRNEKPYLAQGPITNKIIYSGYSCTQGWFFTPCTSDPGFRGLKNILRMHVKKFNCPEWEQVPVPTSVRAIVALNLHSYGSGRNPWGNLTPEYLEKRGFVEAQVDDGLLEIFGLKQGWHASFVMSELISAKHIAQLFDWKSEVVNGKMHLCKWMENRGNNQ